MALLCKVMVYHYANKMDIDAIKKIKKICLLENCLEIVYSSKINQNEFIFLTFLAKTQMNIILKQK
jgi:hypothetical protein